LRRRKNKKIEGGYLRLWKEKGIEKKIFGVTFGYQKFREMEENIRGIEC